MNGSFTYYPFTHTEDIPETVILANGKFPDRKPALNLLEQARHVICCDGAANEYIAKGFTPEVIIGDGDSLLEGYKTEFAGLTHFIPDQETNDLTKAVTYCVGKGYTRATVIGATGKREDHALGNIGLLAGYLDLGIHVQMVTDYGVFTPFLSNAVFESFTGQAVSVFNFGAAHIEGKGLEYPLYAFNCLWQGTLNKSLGKEFQVLTDGKALVYRVF